jgi:hypothetical protein
MHPHSTNWKGKKKDDALDNDDEEERMDGWMDEMRRHGREKHTLDGRLNMTKDHHHHHHPLEKKKTQTNKKCAL